ncbi:MAG: tripartite tricarboxylate transporter substrate binding protein [Variovorax sp.]
MNRPLWRRIGASLRACLATGAALAGLMPGGAAAQNYPTHPVRLIVPVAAGSGFDITGRMLSERLTKKLGQPFVVNNQPGAGTTLGVGTVARAEPDGYTIGMLLSPVTVQQSLIKNMGFDVRKDLAPIMLIGWDFNILVVNASLPVKSVAELIALAKAKPGQLNYASGGNGTPAHIAGEFFKQHTGVDIVHVPYKGAGAAVQDLVTNRVQLMFGNLPATLPQIQAGKLRALAIVGKRRLEALPDVPSIAEVGYPAIDVPNWTAIVAPAGTPRPIIDLLQREIASILAEPAVRERITSYATVIDVQGPEAVSKLINDDVARWAEVVQKAGIKGN